MLQRILSQMRKAIEDYDMIRDGDHIGVGVSGGKDSLVLLLALKALQRFLPVKFTITAITLSMGFDDFNADSLIQFYSHLGVSWHIEETKIGDVVFKTRKETSPCALCSNLKKGVLYEVAKRKGCNKVAFGHHSDDAIATLVMSLVYEGRIHCFSPVTELSRVGLTLIRPMIYVEERQVITCVTQENLHIVKSGCPVDGLTKRTTARKLIASMKSENPKIEATLLGAIQRGHLNGWKPMGKSSQYKKGHQEEQPNLQTNLQEVTNAVLMQLLHPTDIGQSYTNVLRIVGTFLGADRCSLLTYQQDGSMRIRQIWKNEWFHKNELEGKASYPDPMIMNAFGLYMNQFTRKDSGYSEFVFPSYHLPKQLSFWIAQTIQVNQINVALAYFEFIQATDIVEEKMKVLDIFHLLMNKAHERRAFEHSQMIEAQSIQDASERKNVFFANMSHELRNPMNAVIGYIGLLETTKLSNEQKQLIHETKNASDLLLMLVNDVLDYSKIEAGQLQMEKIPFELADCVENAVSLNVAQAQIKGLDLGVFIDPTLPERVVGDPTRMKQILSNIVGNAVKFTTQGAILVEVYRKNPVHLSEDLTFTGSYFSYSFAEDFFSYLRSDMIPGQIQMLDDKMLPDDKTEPVNRLELIFRVSDTGIGMSSETMKKLYQPYQQAEISTVRNYGGTGLGMAITQKLVDLMEGTISVTSREGSGSSFVCQIPFDIDEPVDIVSDINLSLKKYKSDPHSRLEKNPPFNKHSEIGDIVLDEKLSFNEVIDKKEKIQKEITPLSIDIDASNDHSGETPALFSEKNACAEYSETVSPLFTDENTEAENVETNPSLFIDKNADREDTETNPSLSNDVKSETVRSLSVLIIEPSLLQARIIIRYLEYNNCICKHIQSAAGALEIITSGELFEFIAISDTLPDYDASSFIGMLSNIPATQSIPLVIMKNMKNVYTEYPLIYEQYEQSITRPLKYKELLRFLPSPKVSIYNRDLSQHEQADRDTEPLVHDKTAMNARLPQTIQNALTKPYGGKQTAIPKLENSPEVVVSSHPIADQIPEKGSQMSENIDSIILKDTVHIQKPSILIAEDNLVNQTVFTNMLRVYGLPCEIAENGQIALERFEMNHYDIVFMDCQMPVMDGFTATAKIRELNKPQPIIVALTGSNTADYRAHCLLSGMNDFLAKPISMDTLFEWLDKKLALLGFPQKNSAGWLPDHPAGQSSLHIMGTLGLSGTEANQLIKLFLVELDGLIQNNKLSYTDNSSMIKKPVLQNAINPFNYQYIKELTHRLRGSAGSLKLDTFYEQLTLLENAADKQNFEQVNYYLQVLENTKREY